MNNRTNEYQNFKKQLDEIKKSGKKPSLLLHSCCGPCSSYVIELLDTYFDITILYYNPNIYPNDEYQKRLDELQKVVNIINPKIKIIIMDEPYSVYETAIRGHEEEHEGSRRCFECYHFRMEKLAKIAKEKHYDYFTTTLSISPYKNSAWINEIGYRLTSEETIYLFSNFKKEEGYQKSVSFCKKYQIYRQDYCGCLASKIEHEQKINK